jgi:hypothetical protein
MIKRARQSKAIVLFLGRPWWCLYRSYHKVIVALCVISTIPFCTANAEETVGKRDGLILGFNLGISASSLVYRREHDQPPYFDDYATRRYPGVSGAFKVGYMTAPIVAVGLDVSMWQLYSDYHNWDSNEIGAGSAAGLVAGYLTFYSNRDDAMFVRVGGGPAWHAKSADEINGGMGFFGAVGFEHLPSNLGVGAELKFGVLYLDDADSIGYFSVSMTCDRY